MNIYLIDVLECTNLDKYMSKSFISLIKISHIFVAELSLHEGDEESYIEVKGQEGEEIYDMIGDQYYDIPGIFMIDVDTIQEPPSACKPKLLPTTSKVQADLPSVPSVSSIENQVYNSECSYVGLSEVHTPENLVEERDTQKQVILPAEYYIDQENLNHGHTNYGMEIVIGQYFIE